MKGVCIRIWTRDSTPPEYAHLTHLADDGEVENTVFVAHVPATMLCDRIYRMCNGDSTTEGWMREGELGLFGCNALDEFPHPGGDGILLVGSCV